MDETGMYVQGDWFSHTWIFEEDIAGISRMKLELDDMQYNGVSLGKDYNFMVASYSWYVLQVGKTYESEADQFASELMA